VDAVRAVGLVVVMNGASIARAVRLESQ
jgi:hypothetical protein